MGKLKKEIYEQIFHQNLTIESILLTDGITPDEKMQYKVGRKVSQINGEGVGCLLYVFYDEKRYWKTSPIKKVEEHDDKIVLTDDLSIYTFKKTAI